MAERARRVLDAAIANGTTLVRAHPDVDPIVGTLGVEVLAELRREYAGRIDLQIVAFPQEGIEKAPGTLDLMRRAIELGADVVGGCTYNEADVAACERHVLAAFDLAAEHDLPDRPARGLRRRRLRRALRDGLLHRPHHPRARATRVGSRSAT